MAFKLTKKQKEEAMKIAEMGSMFGGSKEVDQYLMEQMMNVLLPQTDKVDELASLYSITKDDKVKSELLNEYYKTQGIDPAQKAQQEALMTQFGEEFPIDSSDAGQNIAYQNFMQQNPEALSQYYTGKEKEPFKWGWIPAGIGAGAAAGAGIGSLGGPIGTVGGGVVGGIAGLIGSIIDSGESGKEKEKRIKSLMEQYKSNIPNN